MKTGTRLVVGVALAVLPLAGGLGFSVLQVESLARANVAASDNQHRASQLTLRAQSRIELADEYRRKWVVTGDEGYRRKLDEANLRIDEAVAEIGALNLLEAERAALSELERGIAADRVAISAVRGAEPVSAAREKAHALFEAHRAALDRHAAWAEERSRDTSRIALVVGVAAVLSSLLVMSLLVRSIERPLAELIRGTRAVGSGNFSFRARAARDDEIGELARAFNHMVDALGALERMKSELLSRVSHELRSPLVAMIETNRLLLDEIPGEVNARQRRMLELSGGAAERLSTMIDDLLELSSLEASPRLDRQAADLGELVRDAVDELGPVAQERRIELVVGTPRDPAVLRCDVNRYHQVVHNLLENALKYSPRGGVVHVGLGVVDRRDLPSVLLGRAPTDHTHFAVLRVDDEGPGVRPEDRERIFEKFVQGSRASRGVGLGLAICRAIVEAHGGVVGVEGSVLGGASFIAALPFSPEVDA